MDYTTLSFADLVCKLYYPPAQDVPVIDEVLSRRIVGMEEVYALYCRAHYLTNYPLTRAALNQVVLEYLNTDDDSYEYVLGSLFDLLDLTVRDRLVELYAAGRSIVGRWRLRSCIQPNSPHNLKLLGVLLRQYNERVSEGLRQTIEQTWKCLPVSDVAAGGKLLCESSNAVKALLLARTDLSDELSVVGLKALSKLKQGYYSHGKDIQVPIKLEWLKRLAPMERLSVVKHILKSGVYTSSPIVQFDELPAKEELINLLFSCSIKHNDRVVQLSADYDTYLLRLKWSKE